MSFLKFAGTKAIAAIYAVGLLALLTACQSAPIVTNSFHHTMDMGDGRYMSIAGESNGHERGGLLELRVSLANGSDEAWRDGYCVLLVNELGVVASLAETTFDLTADEGVADAIETRIPEGADAEAYGLKLLIPGASSLGTTLYIGDGGEDGPPVPAGEGDGLAPRQWALVSSCQAGELPPPEFEIDRMPATVEQPRQAG
ncbi:MAG: hypothetical protein WD645_05920 [Dehalococcoidia bacterium]